MYIHISSYEDFWCLLNFTLSGFQNQVLVVEVFYPQIVELSRQIFNFNFHFDAKFHFCSSDLFVWLKKSVKLCCQQLMQLRFQKLWDQIKCGRKHLSTSFQANTFGNFSKKYHQLSKKNFHQLSKKTFINNTFAYI